MLQPIRVDINEVLTRRNKALWKNIAVIVPVLNEAQNLPSLIQRLQGLPAEQIIVVDGGSTDGSVQLLAHHQMRLTLLHAGKGRALQMNAGAKSAIVDTLLFLHADTQLPPDPPGSTLAKVLTAHPWGRFDVSFDTDHLAMRVIAFFINLRSRLTGIATGDQAIFVRRDLFEAVGGFEDIPLMEDIALCKALRHYHKPYCSRLRVVTSARRWLDGGIVKTVLIMWWYRLAYFCGVSPARLKRGYRDVR